MLIIAIWYWMNFSCVNFILFITIQNSIFNSDIVIYVGKSL